MAYVIERNEDCADEFWVRVPEVADEIRREWPYQTAKRDLRYRRLFDRTVELTGKYNPVHWDGWDTDGGIVYHPEPTPAGASVAMAAVRKVIEAVEADGWVTRERPGDDQLPVWENSSGPGSKLAELKKVEASVAAWRQRNSDAPVDHHVHWVAEDLASARHGIESSAGDLAYYAEHPDLHLNFREREIARLEKRLAWATAEHARLSELMEMALTEELAAPMADVASEVALAEHVAARAAVLAAVQEQVRESAA